MSSHEPWRHLSLFLNPRDHGLTPYLVTFTQGESAPVRSMLEEGMVYRHPWPVVA
jgi:hypothetical protein